MRNVGSGLAAEAVDADLDRGRRARVVVGSAVSVTLALPCVGWPPVYGGGLWCSSALAR